ncbi:MAG: carbohydrate ABC transporter permease [Alphaproteobacteria bacterium]
MHSHFSFNRMFLYTFLVVLTIMCFTPFYMMMINATRSSPDISTGFALLPDSMNQMMANYNRMQSIINIWRGLFNSFVITVPYVLISSYFSALTAWGFTFYRFKGRNILFMIVIGTMMIPPQLGLIGYNEMMIFLGNTTGYSFRDNWISLWFPAFFTGASVFFLRQYMIAAIPYEIVESCRMDGAGELAIFHRVVIPLSMPSIATMGIFTFVYAWNNYLTPLILLDTQDIYPVSLLISTLRNTAYGHELGAIYLAIAISVLPILFAFVFLSRYIINGISAGAVKG